MKKRLVMLISNAGIGTNLQSIIDAVSAQEINAEIVIVISSSEDAFGLTRAKKNNITTLVISKKDDLSKILDKYKIDFICLAGWKLIIPGVVIDKYKILNTHPGLIPDTIDGVVKNPDGSDALWNKGKMTEKAMQSFLDSGATYAGCSNHFLSNEFDFGEVLGRCFEKIKARDTVESLYTRLKKKENKLYVDVLKKLCN